MSIVVQRLKEYLATKGITTSGAESMIDVSNGTLSKPFAKGTNIKTDTLEKFLKVFNDLNPSWLFAKDDSGIPMELSYKTNQEKPVAFETVPKYITVDHEGQENVLFVPVPAQAGYLNGYGDPEFLSSLPSYRLPKLNNGTFRMFEVKGHSMFPTIHSGAIAVGEWCENWTDDIKDNNIYIIISKDDGIVIKRVLNRIKKYGELFLKSDNRSEYPSYPVKPENILEIWKLNTGLLFQFQDPADLYSKVYDLEAELLHIRNLLPKLRGK